MALDLTSFDFALKEYYTDQRVERLTYKNKPLLALMPKFEEFYGDSLPVPVIYGDSQGRSATFSTAVTNKTSTKGVRFRLTRDHDYSLADVDNETLLASENNKGAFMRAAVTEMDSAIHSLSTSMHIDMYRSGSGSRAQVASTSTVTLTLLDADDICLFEVGQELVADDNEPGTSLRTGSATVTGIDRDAGTLTTDSNWTAQITGLTANDYLFVQGDPTAKIKGLSAWIPTAAPGATAFFGVDRTVDTTRLGGNRVTATGLPAEEQLIKLATRIGREGGSPDYCFCDFSYYEGLQKALGAKVQYMDLKAGDVGFTAILVNGPRGPIKVIPDHACQSDRIYMLQMENWKFYGLGKAPRVLNTDGNMWLRLSSSDSVEIRYGYYGQVGCNAPGWSGVATI